jgi:hypothetical protein
LQKASIRTVEQLLERGSTPEGRAAIAEEANISARLVREWVSRADLMRIHGIDGQFSDLLETAGVATVEELAGRDAVRLHARLVEVNEARNLVRQVPLEADVAGWVEAAKALPSVVRYTTGQD